MLHSKTKKKIRLLNDYIKRNSRMLLKKYPNVNGIYVGKKVRGGEVINRYSIIFNVDKKVKEKDLKKLIPPFIEITSMDKRKKKLLRVPTDVRDAGNPAMQRCLASSVSGNKQSNGTITGFITRQQVRYYISNMHVLGFPFLMEGEFEAESDSTEADIRIQGDEVCSFRKGKLEKRGELDIAICEVLESHTKCLKPAFDLDKMQHVSEKDLEFVMAEPIPINGYGFVNSTHNEAKIINLIEGPIIFKEPFGSVQLHKLLVIHPRISADKDSGALIYDDNRNVYGLIVGADKINTYAINLKKSLDYLDF